MLQVQAVEAELGLAGREGGDGLVRVAMLELLLELVLLVLEVRLLVVVGGQVVGAALLALELGELLLQLLELLGAVPHVASWAGVSVWVRVCVLCAPRRALGGRRKKNLL